MQSNASPQKHLHRLGVLILLGVIGFLIIKWLATPSSWNFQVWYRGDSLVELAKKEPVFGGNESCTTCHEEVVELALSAPHKALSCEACHGPLTTHVGGGRKIADALVVSHSSGQCLNCHEQLLGKSEDYPQFAKDPAKRRIRKHKKLKGEALCLKCHGPHDAFSDPERANRVSAKSPESASL